MKEFNFEKSGLEFKFKNPKLNQSGCLVFEWKIIGTDKEFNKFDKENGYYGNAQFDEIKKVILCNFKFNNKKIAGVSLPDNILKELKNLYAELKENRKNLFDKAVNDLAEGRINVSFSIVGCDYPKYQGWIELDKDLKGLEQEIMEKSILKISGEKYISNACEYIERKLKQNIGTKEDIDSKAFNFKFDTETQNYHDFKETIVTNFEMKLADAIKLEEILNIKAKREAERKAIFDKAKATGEKQVLSKWSEDCNDPREDCDVDIIITFALPNGEIETIRNHTW